MKKVTRKIYFAMFPFNRNPYSAGDNFHFSIDLIQNQKHVNKKELFPTWGIAY